MRPRGMSYLALAFGLSVLMAAAVAVLSAGPLAEPSAALQDNALSGVVTGPSGPEAGVWVIAETTDLPTRFIRIVVTDDQGRYVMPDLPNAGYQV